MREFAIFSQLAGMGAGLFQAVALVCFFAVIIFGEKRIRYPSMLRLASLLLVLSYVVPALLAPLLEPLGGGYQRNLGTGEYAVFLIMSTKPLLLGSSLLFAFWSLSIGPHALPTSRPVQPQPKKHPLDD